MVHHPGEIPSFASEAEEAEFWDTHEPGDAMFDRATQSPETQALLAALLTRPRKSRPTSIRLGTELERRLRHLAELAAHHPPADATPAEVLAFLMEGHGLKQTDLADLADQGTISRILGGKRSVGKRLAGALAERFGVDRSVFL